MKTYRILIADDHLPTRSEIRRVLERDRTLTVVDAATDDAQVIQLCQETKPDLVLMDTCLPKMNGFEVTRQIKQRFPQIKVVIVSESDHAANLISAMQFGAQGYLFKQLPPADWLTYLHTLLDPTMELPRDLAKRLFQRGPQDDATRLSGHAVLTVRESEILAFVAMGFTNQNIANSLYISINTVKNHIKNILSKLSLTNRVQLTAYAVRHGLLNVTIHKLPSIAT